MIVPMHEVIKNYCIINPLPKRIHRGLALQVCSISNSTIKFQIYNQQNCGYMYIYKWIEALMHLAMLLRAGLFLYGGNFAGVVNH